MSSHQDHHDNHSEESKPVAFRTPLILGLVTLLAIILLVSTCDKKHGCCENDIKGEGYQYKKDGDNGQKVNSQKEGREKVETASPIVTDSIANIDNAHPEHPTH